MKSDHKSTPLKNCPKSPEIESTKRERKRERGKEKYSISPPLSGPPSPLLPQDTRCQRLFVCLFVFKIRIMTGISLHEESLPTTFQQKIKPEMTSFTRRFVLFRTFERGKRVSFFFLKGQNFRIAFRGGGVIVEFHQLLSPTWKIQLNLTSFIEFY